MQDLINEIRKLIEFAGENGTIKKQDIDKLCIKKIESVIYHFVLGFCIIKSKLCPAAASGRQITVIIIKNAKVAVVYHCTISFNINCFSGVAYAFWKHTFFVTLD